MNYEEKFDFAIKELAAAKVISANYTPPALKPARRIGLKVRPPYYNTFLKNILIHGIYFGFTWGILMYFTSWNKVNMPLEKMFVSALSSGAVFGLFIASYYALASKKLKLTPWHKIENV